MSIHFQQTDLHSWDIHAHPPIDSKTAPTIGTITEDPDTNTCVVTLDDQESFSAIGISSAQQQILDLDLPTQTEVPA